MYNMSSAQGQRFAEIAREMTEKVRALGPSPIKKIRNAECGVRNGTEKKETYGIGRRTESQITYNV
jgi:hypothetical protein